LNIKPHRLAAALLVVGLAVTEVSAQQQPQLQPYHWWQQLFRNCAEPRVEGLPDDAPRSGTVITVDVSTNTVYLFRDGQLVRKSPAATGSGKRLETEEDVWEFYTPRGHMKVKSKIKDPIWRKPDWAFIEAGEKVPPPDSPTRNVKGKLGKYALNLGEGILIHGTDDAGSIGKYASHGCIRVPNGMLETLWKNVSVGTDVFVFESGPALRKIAGQ
jgi:lipoprotein-anchoring transpeptidase ErfK/SrfK